MQSIIQHPHVSAIAGPFEVGKQATRLGVISLLHALFNMAQISTIFLGGRGGSISASIVAVVLILLEIRSYLSPSEWNSLPFRMSFLSIGVISYAGELFSFSENERRMTSVVEIGVMGYFPLRTIIGISLFGAVLLGYIVRPP